ncbi:MAG: DUF1343 domain-containing protein [Thermodesulfobacterium geofontis]|uniref:DUF1343 domain-containing protein n=1 Tax=Thermodesulfobacterium geofontis TaxID=1295609 RepID=A0A2N7PP10_9BACT|nr:MAG: DUF1343 domain-containing protein [Thermodesulfobacterium geofontis]
MIRNPKVIYGVERFFKEEIFKKYKGKKVALLCNQASVDYRFTPVFILFKEKFKRKFKLIFSPQHGLFSEKQANMVASEDEIEPFTQIPVISLYGKRLKPEKEHLDEIEVIFVDLQDIGCRVYTYIWTLYLLMEACEKNEKKLVIFDRPNPIGSQIEGPLLEPEYFSFVGMDILPLRHGLTIGEIANLFKKRKFSNLDLEIIKMKGYKREFLFPQIKRPWIFTSPNIPTWETTLVYPGQVLLEGTNLSEGRGTTNPFLIFGAPYLNLKKLSDRFKKIFQPEKEGFILRPIVFEPTFDKWKGKRCYGFQIHVVDYYKFKPVKTTLLILKTIKENFEDFKFIDGPYEFEERKRPIEILVGNSQVLKWLEEKEKIDLDFYLYYNFKNYLDEVEGCRFY